MVWYLLLHSFNLIILVFQAVKHSKLIISGKFFQITLFQVYDP